jgi:nucleoside-diphosphate-sugar epimerase
VLFWQGKSVIVTGGAGFIGSYMVELLVSHEAKVTVIDNLESGHLENLENVRKEITFIQGDVTVVEHCRHWFAHQDAVLNLAGRAPGVGYSHLNHEVLLGRNILIGSSVLEGARQAGVGRTLVVSSSCVYPDEAPVPTPELPLFTGEPERVNSGYGWAKRFQELQAMHYARDFGMEIALARPFNAYGSRDLTLGARSHVIPAIIHRLLSDAPELIVWGSGSQTRSFMHGRDVAAALLLLTERYAVCDPVNVGHDQEIAIQDLVALLMELSGINKPVVFDTSRPEGCQRKAADPAKLQRVTGGFTPQTDLRAGLLEILTVLRGLQGDMHS